MGCGEPIATFSSSSLAAFFSFSVRFVSNFSSRKRAFLSSSNHRSRSRAGRRRRMLTQRLESRRVLAGSAVISEFLSSNAGGLEDEDGDSTDWIEIYNPSTEAVDLAGWTLSDDDQNLGKWTFPPTLLGPSESLVVFASGKDRAVTGQELHTNFSISSGGEYLGLVDPQGSVATEFAPSFPEQSTNVSYGFLYDTVSLVGDQTPLTTLVPTDASLGASWTTSSFDDSGWNSGNVGVGFGVLDPGFDIRYVKAQSSGSFNGTVNSLTIAEDVLATPAYQSFSVNERRDVINLLGTGGGGNYGNDLAFPSQTVGEDINHFVIEATSTIEVPTSGQWSFGVNSDDGFGLTLSRNGTDYSSSFTGTRGARDTIATFDLVEAGEYEVRLVMFEAAGGASVEFFAAQGAHSSFSNVFDLVGDTASGGLSAFTPYTAGQNPWVATDIQSEMLGVNSSAYVRLPFNVQDASSVESLILSMRHDDGFVAYLNGNEVARQNAPVTPAFDSVATASRSASDVLQPVELFLMQPPSRHSSMGRTYWRSRD